MPFPGHRRSPMRSFSLLFSLSCWGGARASVAIADGVPFPGPIQSSLHHSVFISTLSQGSTSASLLHSLTHLLTLCTRCLVLSSLIVPSSTLCFSSPPWSLKPRRPERWRLFLQRGSLSTPTSFPPYFLSSPSNSSLYLGDFSTGPFSLLGTLLRTLFLLLHGTNPPTTE
ncbi:hypothetical protein ASPBRDRAFT_423383 [Aspergillus brasiliensis CBS 101740]|uniref:Secreted protein n=1 Tax=Aspergillus brasiliensis (strain CBS 101740 / IMI 381727 / IBT 21946) TaxID=767769 RepID=A0A1L9U4M1_ASPBC|nr:hypothetical protein ASPBRDRAFT_423383 [Aspergillus brasiliensis CBS 101740]